MKQKRNISDFETYNINPTSFKGLINRKKKIHAAKHEVVDPNTGEYFLLSEPSKTEDFNVDTLEFRKVFTESIHSIKTFSTPALRVWCYILMNLALKADKITINIEEMLEFTGYKSKSNIYLGLIELLDKEFIFRSTGLTTYFINVNYLYNGKRV